MIKITYTVGVIVSVAIAAIGAITSYNLYELLYNPEVEEMGLMQ